MEATEQNHTRTIKALILCGGRSERMGMDKYKVVYTGKRSHLSRTVSLLDQLQIATFLSCQKDQSDIQSNCPVIVDEVNDQGPLSGIISAFNTYEQPWLVIPCDMPFITEKCVAYLLNARKVHADVNLFQNSERLHPLPAIWEPSGLQKARLAFDSGERSLMKVIHALSVNAVEPINSNWLINVNTAEELSNAQLLIKNGEDYG